MSGHSGRWGGDLQCLLRAGHGAEQWRSLKSLNCPCPGWIPAAVCGLWGMKEGVNSGLDFEVVLPSEEGCPGQCAFP